jgi:hypothetical protein
MTYKDISYQVLIRITPGWWRVSIQPPDDKEIQNIVSGTRTQAEQSAHSMIDRWLARRSRPDDAARLAMPLD